ncbi:Fatty acid desaturase [Rosistilla carotiformis]|uniref:Fatty acid desaturase n=1 Tax=Rosistilla carotiformis TaxID=2528017 RepID=A0A518K1D5_9BACT|nr:fatty acid desaturase family protein [Rosistilla carotiformis]QDV71565.1 Fatty acid desaturase [Rosistilla carotiformis]
MRTVDQILSDAADGNRPATAESELPLPRFSRTRHIESVRALSQINGWRTTGFLVFHWALIIAAMLAAGYSGHWAVYLVAAFVVASRMQAFGVMLHDGAHYLLYKNRSVNDVVSDLFIAFPIGMSTTLYRRTHFRHHRFANTEEDQDLAAQREEHEWFEWPKTRWGCFVTMLRSLLGINAHRSWILFKHWAPWYHLMKPVDAAFPMRARVLYVLSMIFVYSFFAIAIKISPQITFSLMALYVLSGITLLNLINRVRATAEHLGTEQTHELNATRTVIPNLCERIMIAPHGVNYHLEHHLFPSVPGCNLAKLHNELMQDEEFREHAHVTKSYAGVIRELMTPRQNDESPSPTG